MPVWGLLGTAGNPCFPWLIHASVQSLPASSQGILPAPEHLLTSACLNLCSNSSSYNHANHIGLGPTRMTLSYCDGI